MRARISRFSLPGLLLVLLFAWGQAGAEQNYDRGLLWSVTSPEGKTSHILGTIHSSDPEVLGLKKPVRMAFADSRLYVMELIPDAQAITRMQSSMLFAPDEQLKDALTAELYGKVVRAMEKRGVPEAATARMRPWTLLVTLNMPAENSGLILDNLLYQQALKAGMSVQGLETVDEQLVVLTDWPREKIISWLEETVDNLDHIESMQQELMQAWLDRDLSRLQQVAMEMEFGDEADYQEFMLRLVDQRNQRMVARMTASLEEGGAFIAVGALHLPGEQGVLNLLHQRGYRLKALY
jgi:uncharacterized protein YbaP (TraB family)